MRKTPHLIVVDDDEGVRSLLKLLIEMTHPAAVVHDHETAETALEQIESGSGDLLITDCMMPGMDGPTLVSELRSQNRTLPIIMISGNEENRHRGEAVGIDRFIAKRRLTSQLPAAISALLASNCVAS
jgi:two-component system response regulator PhoP